MNTALNRTTLAFLTNKSGGALTYGAVVVLDNTNANGFTTTTTAGLSTRGIGVIFDVAGIANNATGAVAIAGWCPQINLNTASTVGQFVKTHTVAGQGTPHSSPQVEGDFAVCLTASATPSAMLFGSANPPGGSGSGTVTNTGTLTANQLIKGNGGVDITVGDLSGDVTTSGTMATTIANNAVTTAKILNANVTLAKIANASANDKLLGSGNSGSGSAYTEITIGSGLTMTGTTLSSSGGSTPGLVQLATSTLGGTATSVSFTSISSAYTNLLLVCSGRDDVAASAEDFIYVRFNNDSGANYDWEQVRVNNATTAFAASYGQTRARFGSFPSATATANRSGSAQLLITNYAGTTFNKSGLGSGGAVFSTSGNNATLNQYTICWRDTSAINRVDIFPESNNFIAGSVFTLYGLL